MEHLCYPKKKKKTLTKKQHTIKNLDKDIDIRAFRSGLTMWSVYFNNQQFMFLNEFVGILK